MGFKFFWTSYALKSLLVTYTLCSMPQNYELTKSFKLPTQRKFKPSKLTTVMVHVPLTDRIVCGFLLKHCIITIIVLGVLQLLTNLFRWII